MSDTQFGRGFSYCLGLFLAHADRVEDYKKIESTEGCMAWSWYNGAADHLFDLETDFLNNSELKKSAEELKEKALNWRLNTCTWDDVSWGIQRAKDLLLAWDAECGIPNKKGEYE